MNGGPRSRESHKFREFSEFRESEFWRAQQETFSRI